jgi:hypothetical protein
LSRVLAENNGFYDQTGGDPDEKIDMRRASPMGIAGHDLIQEHPVQEFCQLSV